MKQYIALGVIFLLALAGCATPPTPRESGTLGGAAIGAVTGALTGDAVQSEQADRAHGSRYAYAPRPYPPPGGALQIDVTPEDAEIFVDGRRIGLAKELRGPAVVPVAAGQHFVEFHWRGFSVTNHIMVPPQATVPLRRDLGPPVTVLP